MNSNLSRREFIATTTAATLAAGGMPSAFAAAKTVTLAFVGCAHIHTPGFVQLLKKRTDIKVKSVWDHDAARAEQRAGELGAQVVGDLNKIWSDPAIAAGNQRDGAHFPAFLPVFLITFTCLSVANSGRARAIRSM